LGLRNEVFGLPVSIPVVDLFRGVERKRPKGEREEKWYIHWQKKWEKRISIFMEV
jgi:hypothetical protein